MPLGYRLKEIYLHFNKNATEDYCESCFDSIYEAFKEAQLPKYIKFASILKNRKTKILNSPKRTIDERTPVMHFQKISMVRFAHT